MSTSCSSADISVTVQRDELRIKVDELNDKITQMQKQCPGKRGASNSESESLLNVDAQPVTANYFITSCVFFGSPCTDFKNSNTTGGWPDIGFPDDRPEATKRNTTERGYKAFFPLSN